jgi:hypothetical protein
MVVKKLLPAFMGIALGLGAFGCMEAFVYLSPIEEFSPAACIAFACLVAFVCCFLFIRVGERERIR